MQRRPAQLTPAGTKPRQSTGEVDGTGASRRDLSLARLPPNVSGPRVRNIDSERGTAKFYLETAVLW